MNNDDNNPPPRPLTRRGFVRDSAIATGAFTLAGLIRAEGVGGGGTTGLTTAPPTTGTTTTTITTGGPCGLAMNVSTAAGDQGKWGEAMQSPTNQMERFPLIYLVCANGHKLVYRGAAGTLPAGVTPQGFNSDRPTYYVPALHDNQTCYGPYT